MKDSLKIFIVEDDKWYGELLEYILKLNPEHDIHKFTNGKDCIDHLHLKPDIITLDYSLADMDGSAVLEAIKKYNADTQVIIISGQDDISTAVSLLKKGAFDYIVKDEDAKDRLWNSIKNIRENLKLKETIQELKEQVEQKYHFKQLIGESKAILKVQNLMSKALKSIITVSISGETGTGKEVVAKAIHYNSKRKNKPFIPINVAAIPSELVESELFGHEKGAFTGATSAKPGKFQQAHNGTLFLDEIGEMDLNMQSKLLRALQEMEVVKVGGSKAEKVDFRLIVATHKNLKEEVSKGNFREDLYYRLLGLPIHLPPLRERANDVLILAKHFTKEFCNANAIKIKTLSASLKSRLLEYPFPGNVRELKAVIELACVMSDSDTMEADDLTFSSSQSMSDFLLEEKTLKQYTIDIITYFLNKYDNHVVNVSKKLDVGKSTIYRMIQNGEITEPKR